LYRLPMFCCRAFAPVRRLNTWIQFWWLTKAYLPFGVIATSLTMPAASSWGVHVNL